MSSDLSKKYPQRWYDMNKFVDVSMRDLTRSEIAVWLVLFRHAKERSVTISHARIAEASGCSVNSVNAAMKSLVEKGIVKQLIKGSINRGASVYLIRGFSGQYPPK